jgi:uncharacterized DUF497 family protein
MLPTNVTTSLHGIPFSCDHAKAAANQRKHGVSFSEAREVFFDPTLRLTDQTTISGDMRQRISGMTETWQLLLVVFVERGDHLRLISARAETLGERRPDEDA